MAEKYHLLPSEVHERGTYFDVMAMDVKGTYDAYQAADGNGKAQMLNTHMSGDEMQMIMNRAKGLA